MREQFTITLFYFTGLNFSSHHPDENNFIHAVVKQTLKYIYAYILKSIFQVEKKTSINIQP